LGRPFQGTPDEYAVVLGWSRFPNTIMKLSSLPTRDQYPHRELDPIIKNLTQRFGPDRLIYGGGFGAEATGDSYRAYREKVRSYLVHQTVEDQAKIFGGTAAKLFGFPSG
jgi:predicted TIM-barrel fold metal-dependent hydrolase